MSQKLTTIERWERFWSKVEKTPTCWLWTGSTNSGGYGSMSFYGHICGAHRLMLVWMGQLKHPIHDGDGARNIVLHSCDNPRCVNPAHLTIGTNTQNQREAYARGLRTAPKGSDHANSRLTTEQVRDIRRLYDTGQMLQIPLAKMYGVSQAAISLITRRKTYTCVL